MMSSNDMNDFVLNVVDENQKLKQEINNLKEEIKWYSIYIYLIFLYILIEKY